MSALARARQDRCRAVRDILDELTKRNVKLSLGGSIHDPTDPVGRLLFNVLAMVVEFESDLIRMDSGGKGRLRGKQPKLRPNQAKHLLELHDLGGFTAQRFGRDAKLRGGLPEVEPSELAAKFR